MSKVFQPKISFHDSTTGAVSSVTIDDDTLNSIESPGKVELRFDYDNNNDVDSDGNVKYIHRDDVLEEIGSILSFDMFFKRPEIIKPDFNYLNYDGELQSSPFIAVESGYVHSKTRWVVSVYPDFRVDGDIPNINLDVESGDLTKAQINLDGSSNVYYVKCIYYAEKNGQERSLSSEIRVVMIGSQSSIDFMQLKSLLRSVNLGKGYIGFDKLCVKLGWISSENEYSDVFEKRLLDIFHLNHEFFRIANTNEYNSDANLKMKFSIDRTIGGVEYTKLTQGSSVVISVLDENNKIESEKFDMSNWDLGNVVCLSVDIKDRTLSGCRYYLYIDGGKTFGNDMDFFTFNGEYIDLHFSNIIGSGDKLEIITTIYKPEIGECIYVDKLTDLNDKIITPGKFIGKKALQFKVMASGDVSDIQCDIFRINGDGGKSISNDYFRADIRDGLMGKNSKEFIFEMTPLDFYGTGVTVLGVQEDIYLVFSFIKSDGSIAGKNYLKTTIGDHGHVIDDFQTSRNLGGWLFKVTYGQGLNSMYVISQDGVIELPDNEIMCDVVPTVDIVGYICQIKMDSEFNHNLSNVRYISMFNSSYSFGRTKKSLTFPEEVIRFLDSKNSELVNGYEWCIFPYVDSNVVLSSRLDVNSLNYVRVPTLGSKYYNIYNNQSVGSCKLMKTDYSLEMEKPLGLYGNMFFKGDYARGSCRLVGDSEIYYVIENIEVFNNGDKSFSKKIFSYDYVTDRVLIKDNVKVLNNGVDVKTVDSEYDSIFISGKLTFKCSCGKFHELTYNNPPEISSVDKYSEKIPDLSGNGTERYSGEINSFQFKQGTSEWLMLGDKTKGDYYKCKLDETSTIFDDENNMLISHVRIYASKVFSVKLSERGYNSPVSVGADYIGGGTYVNGYASELKVKIGGDDIDCSLDGFDIDWGRYIINNKRKYFYTRNFNNITWEDGIRISFKYHFNVIPTGSFSMSFSDLCRFIVDDEGRPYHHSMISFFESIPELMSGNTIYNRSHNRIFTTNTGNANIVRGFQNSGGYIYGIVGDNSNSATSSVSSGKASFTWWGCTKLNDPLSYGSTSYTPIEKTAMIECYDGIFFYNKQVGNTDITDPGISVDVEARMRKKFPSLKFHRDTVLDVYNTGTIHDVYGGDRFDGCSHDGRYVEVNSFEVSTTSTFTRSICGQTHGAVERYDDMVKRIGGMDQFDWSMAHCSATEQSDIYNGTTNTSSRLFGQSVYQAIGTKASSLGIGFSNMYSNVNYPGRFKCNISDMCKLLGENAVTVACGMRDEGYTYPFIVSGGGTVDRLVIYMDKSNYLSIRTYRNGYCNCERKIDIYKDNGSSWGYLAMFKIYTPDTVNPTFDRDNYFHSGVAVYNVDGYGSVVYNKDHDDEMVRRFPSYQNISENKEHIIFDMTVPLDRVCVVDVFTLRSYNSFSSRSSWWSQSQPMMNPRNYPCSTTSSLPSVVSNIVYSEPNDIVTGEQKLKNGVFDFVRNFRDYVRLRMPNTEYISAFRMNLVDFSKFIFGRDFDRTDKKRIYQSIYNELVSVSGNDYNRIGSSINSPRENNFDDSFNSYGYYNEEHSYLVTGRIKNLWGRFDIFGRPFPGKVFLHDIARSSSSWCGPLVWLIVKDKSTGDIIGGVIAFMDQNYIPNDLGRTSEAELLKIYPSMKLLDYGRLNNFLPVDIRDLFCIAPDTPTSSASIHYASVFGGKPESYYQTDSFLNFT